MEKSLTSSSGSVQNLRNSFLQAHVLFESCSRRQSVRLLLPMMPLVSAPELASWADSGTSTIHYQWALERAYKILSSKDIFSFINQHDVLQELLFSLSQNIQHYFPEANLVLEKFVDPEEDHEKLVVYIQTNRSVPDALKLYDQFIELYWIHEAIGAGDILATTLEFHDAL